MDDLAIKVSNVSKIFRLPRERQSSVKSLLVNLHRSKRGYIMQRALEGIEFDIKKGEFFGIVGRNGSGKSTLLKILAGIYTPSTGSVQVDGKLTPFIELGVGFNPELTGRENIYLNGALLGFSRKEMNAMYQDIVDFAELEKFMDQKLKNYSSGMQVRLAFSIAIRSKSDILLIDEVLAVGDINFQRKCYDVFRELKRRGVTIVFVSHDLTAVEEFCDRAALVDRGKLRQIGDPTEITMRYRSLMAGSSEAPEQTSEHIGTGEVRINKLEVLANGKPVKQINEGQAFGIRIEYTASKKIDTPVFGLAIVNHDGSNITGPNTQEAGITLAPIKGKGWVTATIKTNLLNPGRYSFMASCYNQDLTVPYDFVKKIGSLEIIGKERHGLVNLEPTWTANDKTS